MTMTKRSSFVKIFCGAFLCMSLVCGCSSTYTVGAKETGADIEFNQLGAEFGKHEVRIILTNEDERRGTDVVCSKDSISWRLPPTILVRRVVPRSQVFVVERMSGKSGATISFTNGEQLSAEEVVVTTDSVSWMVPIKVSLKISIPTSQIKKIVLINRPRGVLDGAEYGLLSGVASGAIMMVIPPVAEFPEIYLIFGSGAGLLAGTLVGLGVGHRYEYEFLHQPDKP